MIVPMTRLRVLGPIDRLDAVISAAQDAGRLHVVPPALRAGLAFPAPTAHELRRHRHIARRLQEADEAMQLLGISAGTSPRSRPTLDVAIRTAARAARHARGLAARDAALREERAMLVKHRAFLDAVLPVLQRLDGARGLAAHALVLPDAASADGVRDALVPFLGSALVTERRPLPDGSVAVVLVLPMDLHASLERQLAQSRLPEVPMPDGYRDGLQAALPRMAARLKALPTEVEALEQERRQTAAYHAVSLVAARATLADWIAVDDARIQCGLSRHAFALEGWVPSRHAAAVSERVQDAGGDDILVEQVDRAEWGADEAPVVLHNPAMFRPFERLLSLMPLPRYGSLDPTPFMAVFFPLIFGMILGDIGYALMLAAGAWWIRRGAVVGTLRRDGADIALACAAFALVFGVLFGEFFGDLGRIWFGLEALGFDREHSVMAALALAVGLGVVHVVLGLVLGALSQARHAPRHALGRGVSAIMILLVVAALLAATEVLPSRLFSPAVIALLIAFPVLVAAEGLIAPVEFLATLGNVLSYARIMAIGTASVMLAVVANSMVGTIGSTIIGVVFALLFHLVNFAIGLFSPAIHALRLHYVEFFGKFYDAGGRPYTPLTHWSPVSHGSTAAGGLR